MAAPFISGLFEPYADCGQSIIIAVSGGGDSMALMDLYRQAKQQNPNLPSPFIVTVDHGLRDGFDAEAALVEAYCGKHNLPWNLLKWEGEKPKTGIMAAARLARYRLLADAAQEIGATSILTGHTLDDLHETMDMRGLRGEPQPMDTAVLFGRRVWIKRPLLNVSRADLRMHLAENQVAFADDPTNTNMRFERARMRALRAKDHWPLPESQKRQALIEHAANFILQNVRLAGDQVFVSRPPIRAIDTEILGLRYLAATIGQFEYPAPLAVGVKLSGLLGAGNNGEAYTAQRCRFVRTGQGFFIAREARHQKRPLLNGTVSPFETFCAQSMHPLANALAHILQVSAFSSPEFRP